MYVINTLKWRKKENQKINLWAHKWVLQFNSEDNVVQEVFS